ncbi:MAG: T9SS type A sorting domain-containing protein [Chitinophagaceae bacterium]|nr:T9SS type A sorting domain-containing protein [Chitinophagaceae bacterium]
MLTIKKTSLIIGIGLIAMSYTTVTFFKDPTAPLSYTGAPKYGATPTVRYCTSCHGDFTINTPGGSVIATGLPSGTYIAGQVYNFSIKITGPGSVWGFSIKAVNTVNNANVGVFSTTNSNTIVHGVLGGTTYSQELSQDVAVISATASYTYVNLRWTAPTVPTANESNIRFYIVGLAGDQSLDEAGDYVYSTTVNATLSTLPITLSSFTARAINNNAVNLKWQTAQESNMSYFDIESSVNSVDWIKIATINSKSNSNTTQPYSFIDQNPIIYNSNIYYRLKMVDLSGTTKYSPVQIVKLKNIEITIDNLSGQPLTLNKSASFKINSNSNKSLNVSVTDVNGRILYNQNTMLTNGSNHIEIPGWCLIKASGIVFIKFATNDFTKTFKQIIN